MDYTELASELFKKMHALHKAKLQKNIDGALRGEMFVLNYIALKGSGVLPSEISNEMGVTSARIAVALNGLENKNLITRRIDENDRRKILVELTLKGEDLTKKHQDAVKELAAKMLGLLGEHDAKEYVRIMGRLAEIAPCVEFNSELMQSL